MRRRVYYNQTVGMGLRPGLVPAQYSAWVLTGTRGDRQEAVVHRITLLHGSCLGDISLSQTSYLRPAWVAFSFSYYVIYFRYICSKVYSKFQSIWMYSIEKAWSQLEPMDFPHTEISPRSSHTHTHKCKLHCSSCWMTGIRCQDGVHTGCRHGCERRCCRQPQRLT